MSDTKLDIARQKYAEYNQHLKEAMEDECKNCDSRVTKGCLYYDEEEDSFDYEQCFSERGY